MEDLRQLGFPEAAVATVLRAFLKLAGRKGTGPREPGGNDHSLGQCPA